MASHHHNHHGRGNSRALRGASGRDVGGPACRHCGSPTALCPLGEDCPGTRVTGAPRPCSRCHHGLTCPVHGRNWAGTL
ncbi:hypothetical protein GCM10012320_32910 [Sinomonas cellulolyticus]|uniref:Uncharacterized protein n=1 Tax=Sinomonas cellulolyticus TaxID=2801916 RepID=A0ABS1JXA6_9MICC|nr:MULTISPECIES: hypothetical protein [Sinomonas]MBL0703984.1 hypothetical protein [Sinomonas cellulolyticus]GHG59031.1 hypothetical protein GCM10012320_32910 [Sinomonas sp. KCTC 49339]